MVLIKLPSQQQGSVLIMVLAALMIIGILLTQMCEVAVLDDRLTQNFIRAMTKEKKVEVNRSDLAS